MPTFGLFCKSFRRDVDRFGGLLRSVLEHDGDRLPFVLSVPREDRDLFSGRFGNAGGRLELVTDEQIVGGGVAQSWRGQQIVKLHAWRLGFADEWLMVDSDFAFIRDFTAADFRAPDGTPYFVVSPNWHKYDPANEALLAHLRGERDLPRLTRADCAALSSDRRFGTVRRWRILYDRVRGAGMYERMGHIRRMFGRPGADLHYMPGPVWTRELNRRFHEEFLAPRRISYSDLVRLSPWEYMWVGEWLLASGFSGFEPHEPFFLHFDSDDAIAHARAAGLSRESLARRYLGLALAAGHQAIESF